MTSRPLTNEGIQLLVEKAQNGDTDAYGKVYDHFFASIYRYVSFRLPSDLVEDVVADIFVQGWEKLHSYSARANVPFGAWLFRIARHKVIDLYRTQRHFDEVSEELVDPDELNRAESGLERQYLLKSVRDALKQMPKKYQEILVLFYMADLPHDEIARILRIREGTVRILKFRALKKLEALLPPDIQDHSAT